MVADGGGIYSLADGATASLNLNSSIVADSIGATSDFVATTNAGGGHSTLGGFNLIETQTGYTGGIVSTADPQLLALGDNGGPTPTHALPSTSPAVNTGGPSGSGFDQRGNPFLRGVGSQRDIGAFEIQAPASFVVSTLSDVVDGNYGPGQLSLRESILFANLFPGASTITFDNSLSGGTINLVSQLPTITTDLTITGLGADLLTIDAGNGTDGVFATGDGFRIFEIWDGDSVSPNLTVSVSGLTLTGGDVGGPAGASGSEDGGAIVTFENLTLNNVVIAGNATQDEGGAINAQFGTLNINDSTMSGNKASNNGGAILVTDSVINVTGSTFSANTARLGGAVVLASNTEFNLTNSTLSGNSATDLGGGIFNVEGVLRIDSSTFAGNTAVNNGDALANLPVGGLTQQTELTNSIVTGSVFLGFNTLTGNYNLFSTSVPITGTGNLQNTDPLLDPLASNGGPTQTHKLQDASPAVNAGDPGAVAGSNGVPQFDQRGTGFGRVLAGRIDIGSFERIGDSPSLIVTTAADVADPFDALTSLREAITYANSKAGADTITFDTAVFNGEEADVIRQQLGQFTITEAVHIDGGTQQVVISGDAGGDDERVSGTFITDIATSAAQNKLSDNSGRIFDVIASAGSQVKFTGLTVTGAYLGGLGTGIKGNNANLIIEQSSIAGNSAAGDGGGIHTDGGAVMLVDSTVSGNSSTSAGGGIFTSFGVVTVAGSTVSGNSSAGAGGGIRNGSSTVTVTHSTVTGNSASGSGTNGGGVYSSGNVVLANSIVAGNTSTGTGPDIYLSTSTSPSITASYSLIGSNEGNGLTEAPTADSSGNLIGGPSGGLIDPNLGALASNGGPTQTHELLIGSPAINAGDPSAVAGSNGIPQFDQRGTGFGRVLAGRIDMGAFERVGDSPSLIVTTAADTVDPFDTLTSLREAITYANSKAGADTITFDTAVFNGEAADVILLQLGQFTIREAVHIDGGTQQVVVSGDAGGNDERVAGTFITDIAASAAQNKLGDNSGRIFDVIAPGGSEVKFTGLTVTGAYLGGLGAGIKGNDSNLVIERSSISGNSAAGDGGGIHTGAGAVMLTDSTISGNSSTGVGGGIFTASGNVTVASSTVSGNSGTGSGGGMHTGTGTVTVTHGTVTGNSVTGSTVHGGGIYSGGNVNVANSIVAGNTGDDVASSTSSNSAPDIFLSSTTNPSITASYSLIGSSEGNGLTETPTADSNGNLIGGPNGGLINPSLGPLASNGGPTQTHALLAGSPAIDAGDPNAVAGSNGVPQFDQRGTGFDRVLRGRLDMGALEDSRPNLLSFARQTPSSQTTNADVLVFRGTFDEDVVNVDVGDFAVDGGTTAIVSSVNSVDARTYDITVAGGDLAGYSGTVGLNVTTNDIADLAGNPLTPGEPPTDEAFIVDNTAPTLLSFTRQSPTSQVTNADTLVFRATFDDNVVNVDASDFAVDGGSTAAVTNVASVDARTYDITVAGGNLASFHGAVGLNVATNDIADLLGNPLASGEPSIDETFTLDNLAPQVLSFTRQNPTSQNTDADTLVFRATFDEDVTNVDAGDFAVGGGSTAIVTNVTSVDARTYDITVSGGDLADFNGTVGLDVAINDVADLVGNSLAPGEPPTDETFLLDNTPVVSTLDDIADNDFSPGNLSLREAILITNGSSSMNAIRFSPSLSGGTINITSQLPTITGDLTITGLGSSLLTIDAGDGADGVFATGDGYRIFEITDSASSVLNVVISGLTLTGGDLGGSGFNDDGGAILSRGENLTLRNVVLTANAVAGNGGAVNFRSGTLKIIDATLAGNRAGGFGGGLNASGATANVIGSTIANNSARNAGGVTSGLSGTLNVTNSTISGNSATEGGGGILGFSGNVNINHSTVVGNTAGLNGGALYGGAPGNLIATFDINNSIIAGSVSVFRPMTGSFNLFSENVGLTGIGNLQSTDPKLGPLANNGGPTQTHALLSDSPALNAAHPELQAGVDGVPQFDQRGTGFGRVLGGRADIGAYETFAPDDPSPRLVSFRRQDPASPFTTADTLVFRATFNEPVTQVDATDFTVDGGSTAGITQVLQVDPRTYDITVSGGDLAGFNGGVGLSIATGNNITDPEGNPLVASEPGIDQQYGLSNVSTVVVSTLGDAFDDNFSAGQLSLREAIVFANTLSNVTTITFDNSLAGGTISTISQLPTITSDVTITGLGSSLLTIDAGNGNDNTFGTADGHRIFDVNNDSVLLNVEISGLTLTGGDPNGRFGADRGGAINSTENLMLRDMVLSGNSAPLRGGAIYTSSGTLNITDSTISQNHSTNGGGIYTFGPNTNLNSSTVDQNTATSRGGGIYITGSGPNVAVINSTLSGNSANVGGGIVGGSGVAKVAHSTLANNTATSGAALFGFGNNPFEINNSIIAGSVNLITTPTGNYNLFSETVAITGNGNLQNTDPLLEPLASNGGPTQTHALQSGSPALGAGDPSAVAGSGGVPQFDQRGTGFSRVSGGRLDIGAFEDSPPTLLSFTRQTPASQLTSADTLVFRATFDEEVQNVDATDFLVTGGTLATVTNVNPVDGRTYDITVSGGDLAGFNGAVGLDLSNTNDVTDAVGNLLTAEEPSTDETFALDNIAPQVESITYEGVTAQRSVIRSVTVTFDSQVIIDPGAFVLTTKSGTPVSVTPAISLVGGKTQAALTFSGAQVAPSGSLLDGNYRLTILDTHVRDLASNALDGDKDGTPGASAVDEFFRFFGDADGDRDVDRRDFAFFQRTNGRRSGDPLFNAAFDWDNDGDVDRRDYAFFRRNYLKTLAP